MSRMTLGQHIRRERGKMTAKELARRARITAGYLCDIEHDRRLPSLPVLRRIGRIIDVEYGCNHGPCRRCGAPWPR